MKHLKGKDKVYESWFNPILSGNTINQGSNILPPGSFNINSSPFGLEPGGDGSNVHFNSTNDMTEKPAWLDQDDQTIVRNGDILSIGCFYLNGVPLSSWSANFGSQGAYQQKQSMRNWYYLDALTKQLFPDGIKAYLGQDEETVEYNISKLVIIRLVPNSNAIGLNAYIKFNLNETEIWGKFENIGIDPKPKFICGDIILDQLPIESKIKIEGKIWNIMINWFKAPTGVYQCIAKDVLVYSELGQLKKLSEGNTIEVINSDDNKIKIKYDNTVYFIKKPTYFWFHWYFTKK